MFVRISGPGGQPALVEAEDCKKFHVSYGGADGTPAQVAAALGDWAAGATDEHVWIRIAAVRSAAAGTVGPGWDGEFDGMVGYAASKGWLNEAGDAIAAHVEVEP